MEDIENCIRLTKSPYYNKPMILLLWQKAFIEALYSFKMSKEYIDKGIFELRIKFSTDITRIFYFFIKDNDRKNILNKELKGESY